jgi:hypothetical protein
MTTAVSVATFGVPANADITTKRRMNGTMYRTLRPRKSVRDVEDCVTLQIIQDIRIL